MDAEINFRRPKLYPKQFAAIYEPKRYSVIEASTKSGKTAGSIVWLVEQALMGGPGDNYWWVAPIYLQAEIAFNRMRRALPRDFASAIRKPPVLTLPNEAQIWFKSAENPDSLYGEDVRAMVIDEASRVSEASWHACRSVITATRGPVRIIGNVKGKKNWFYQLARRAEAGDATMGHHTMSAYDAVDAGVLHGDEIEDARRTLPSHVFKELYLAEAADDDGNPFGEENIRACIGGPKGWLAPGPVKWWGWDLAKSMDYTVGIGLNKFGGVAAFHRFQHPWEDTVRFIKSEVGHQPALIDSTGVGDPIVERLQREVGENFQGYKFSQMSKQKLMEGLSMRLSGRQVQFPDGVIPIELRQFEYHYRPSGVIYSAPEGMHDDAVYALALAAQNAVLQHKAYDKSLSWV